ncbi:MAG: tRNA pseudouridine(55) synthase TruB [Desulfobacteraceae bacterium]|nr:tRNA pseudouridine(55) synthase TruB [Desulfobacteraceae bacterium]
MTETYEVTRITEKSRPLLGAASKNSGISAGNGILVVDKPGAKTSADVVNRVKKLAGIYKTGHAGTLDPFATGVLICPVNRATRLSRFFLQGTKKYEAVLRLGMETDTLDRTGKITAKHPVPKVSEEKLERIAKEFTGRIRQVPPAYSALKHNGIPLYKYAREGKPIQKPARTIEIYGIRITRLESFEIGLEIVCSGGTYIRSLCADIGKTLGCGGHVSELVRTESCGLTLDGAVSPASLEAAGTPEEVGRFLVPMADALHGMKSYTAIAGLAEKIRFGRPISAADLDPHPTDPENSAGTFIKIVDNENRLLAVIEKDGDKSGYSYCCVFQSN